MEITEVNFGNMQVDEKTEYLKLKSKRKEVKRCLLRFSNGLVVSWTSQLCGFVVQRGASRSFSAGEDSC